MRRVLSAVISVRLFAVVGFGLVIAFALSACHGGLHPVFVVDSGLDAPDMSPGDGTCVTVAATCTLRAAIDEANALTGGDRATVELSIDVTLSVSGHSENANATGDLDVLHDLTLNGMGFTIDAAGLDRVIDHHSGELSILDVTITGGDTSGQSYPGRSGGGLYLHGGDVALVAVAVVDNTSPGTGGGVFHGTAGSPSLPASKLVIESSAITDNTGLGGGGDPGAGGLGHHSGTPDIEIRNTLIARNSAENYAGGFYVSGDYPNSGHVLVQDSVIEDNHVVNGWPSATAGGFQTMHVDVAIERTRISENSANSASAGGHYEGNFLLVDSLVAGNSSTDTFDSDSLSLEAGANHTLEFRGATIVENLHAGPTGTEVGIFVWGPGVEVLVDRSLIRGTRSGLGIGHTTGNDTDLKLRASVIDVAGGCSSGPGVASLGYNWFSDSTCSLIGSDTVGSDPLLGPLQDNGGPVETMLPLGGSPLLDAIPWLTAGVCDGTTASDTRGMARPSTVASACDIGPVERQPGDT